MTSSRRQPSIGEMMRATAAKLLNQWRPNPYSWAGGWGWAYQHRVKGSYIVTPETALAYSVAFACMRCIAETLSCLPWKVYERRPDDTLIYRPDQAMNYLLNRRPNADVSAMMLREQLVMDILGRGNAYAQIQWTNGHQPYALWPIPAAVVRVERESNGDLVYIVRGSYGAGTEEMRLGAGDMLHWRNVSCDGVLGLSTLTLAAHSIGYAKEMELFGTTAFQNAPFLGGWLESPERMSKDQADRFKESWREKYMGWLHAGETPVFEGGVTFHQAQLPLADAQFLESRIHQGQEVCRYFRVPQFKVGLDQAAGADSEQAEIDFVNETCYPMACRLQGELDYKCFEGPMRVSKFVTMHDLTPILRGALKDRFDAYSVALRYGFYSINDVLQMEGMNKIEGGDLRTVQLNTVPLNQFAALADVKLDQAQADVAYREAQTEQLENNIEAQASVDQGTDGNAAGDGSSNDGSSTGPNGDGSEDGQQLFEPAHAANPPDDELKQAAQAVNRLRFLLEQKARQQLTTASVPQPLADLKVNTNGRNHHTAGRDPAANRRPRPN